MRALLQDERIRFLMAGGLAALINWLVRFPLSGVLPYWGAVACATAVGMCAGFFLYRALVFRKSDRPVIWQVSDFILVNLGAGTLAVLVAVLLRAQLPWPAMLVDQAPGLAHMAGIAVGAVANYFGHKILTFR